jgi:hypothetical protein
MKNLLTLHEAVVVVLLKMPNMTGTFEQIAEKIESRGLFTERKGGILLSKQIQLRTTLKSSRYKDWFEFKKPDTLALNIKIKS